MENLEMKNLEMKNLFGGVFCDKNVLITGHTGFKGSWLALWLSRMGAKITGYASTPLTTPNHHGLLDTKIRSIIGDIRDLGHISMVFMEHQPEIVFHLAAQPIVRQSYKEPVETFETNVMGTVNVLEASRSSGSVRAVVIITSDKCYENQEWEWGYREIDRLGGFDPYSSSKACAELVTDCWRNSFFNLKGFGHTHHTLISSCRAGNVIGGGDWGADRLIPDAVKAVSRHTRFVIRSPHSVRPWQHVLDPLSGYLLVGQRLLEGRKDIATPWNFGPSEMYPMSVKNILDLFNRYWQVNHLVETQAVDNAKMHEARHLTLDCVKANTRLNWTPVWQMETAVKKTALWYKKFYESGKIQSLEDIRCFVEDARKKKVQWVEK